MIGELNRRIVIKTPTISTDVGGGTSVTYSAGYSLWAKADNRSGRTDYSESQRQATYDYRFKVRYFPSAIITTSQVVQYDSKTLRINSVERATEGRIDFCYLNCSEHGGT